MLVFVQLVITLKLHNFLIVVATMSHKFNIHGWWCPYGIFNSTAPYYYKALEVNSSWAKKKKLFTSR